MPIGYIDYNSPSPNTGVPGALAQAYSQYKLDEDRRANLLMQQQHNKALEDHAASELEMQRRQEEEGQRKARLVAIQNIGSAIDAGRVDYAKQIMQEYKIPFQEVVKHQNPRDALAMPSQDTGLAPEEGPQATPEIAANAGRIRAEQASFEPNAGPDSQYQGAAEAERGRFADAQEQSPFAPGGMRPPAPDKTTYMIAGQEYDPQQSRAAAQARRQQDAEENRRSFEQLGPGIGDFAYAMTMGGNDKASVAALVRQHLDAQQADQSRTEDKAAQRDFQAEQNRMFRMTIGDRNQLADRNGQWGIEKAKAFAAPKFESTDIAATKAVEQSLGSQWKNTEMDKLLSSTRLMGQANAALRSDDSEHPGAAQVGARTLMERVIRQGIPTAYLDERERQEVTGITGKIESLVSRLAGEGLGEQEKAAYQHELDTYAQQLQGYVQRSVGALQSRIQTDPQYRNVRGTADQWLRGRVGAYGITLPGGETENRLPSLGSRSSAIEDGRRGQREQDASRADVLTGGDAGASGSPISFDQGGGTGQGFNPPRLTAEERQPASPEEMRRLAGGSDSFSAGRQLPAARVAAGGAASSPDIGFSAEATKSNYTPEELDAIKSLDHQTDPREMARIIQDLTARGLIRNAQVIPGGGEPAPVRTTQGSRPRRGQVVNDAVRSLDDLAKAHGL